MKKYTVKEAAEETGLSHRTVADKARKHDIGQLEIVDGRSTRLFTESQIELLKLDRRVKRPSAPQEGER